MKRDNMRQHSWLNWNILCLCCRVQLINILSPSVNNWNVPIPNRPNTQAYHLRAETTPWPPPFSSCQTHSHWLMYNVQWSTAMPNLFRNPIHSSIRVHFKNSHHLKSVQVTITGVHPPLTPWGCGRFLCLAELCTHSYFLPWFIKINEISLPGSYQPSQPAISCSNYNNLHVVEIALPVCIVILKCGHKIHLSSLRSRAPGLTARW